MMAGKNDRPFTWMKMGLSLQINSANNDTTNIVRKIQSDQYPRRLALKFSQRRLLSGESAIAFPVGGAASPIGDTAAVSGGLIPARASTSDLPRFEVDTRIDPRVCKIGDQVHDHTDKRENIKGGEHNRIIAVENALEPKQYETIERENGLDQQRTREEGVHESGGKARNNNQHGIAEHMAIEHLIVGAPLGARGEHILLANFFKE